MIDLIYSQHLQKIFTNRKKEIELLEFLREELIENRQIRLSFFGLRRIGKSLILKEFLKNHLKDEEVKVIYLNLEEFTTNPEDFALNYIGRICFWVFKRGDLEDYIIPEKLLLNVPKRVQDNVLSVISILKREKIDRTLLLNTVFSFPATLSKKLGIKTIILLDEFQKILELKKFRDCKDILNLFRAKIEASNVTYVIAGSAISVMRGLIADHESPLFNQFKEEPIDFFDKISTRGLVGKILKCDTDVKDFLHNLVNGHPFYVNSVASRAKIMNKILGIKVDKNLIKKAFLIESLSKSGDIYKHCEYVYDISLERAKFSNTLKSVLKILAKEEGLTQSQIARKLRVTQGASRSYLNELVAVDLLVEKDRNYFFKDKVLRHWLSYRELGVEISEFPRKKVLNELIKGLEENYLRVSSELGKTKEYEAKEKLEKKFEIKLENYKTEDGKLELDLVGKKGGYWYIFEIKWRNRKTGYKEVKKFLEKVKKSKFKNKKKLFFISKSGFTKNAKDFALKNGIELMEKLN